MADPNDLTPREMEVLALSWQCMESEPKLDYVKLAQLTNYTVNSASVTFGKIKRKLKAKAAAGSSGGASGGQPATPKKPVVPRKPKTPGSGKRGSAGDGADGTPSKKAKNATKHVSDSDEDEEFAKYAVKKEEVTDINAGANSFFDEATAYAMGEI